MARCVDPQFKRIEKGHIWVPCGKCLECLQRKQQDMTFRLLEELRNAKTAYFVTLTYSDEHLPSDGKLKKEHLRNYLKRCREAQYDEWNQFPDLKKKIRKSVDDIKLRYYAIGEYGDQFDRPHYHAIIFNAKDVGTLVEKWADYDEANRRKGPLGFVKVGTVNLVSIQYVTKYFIKRKDEENQPLNDGLFSLSSKNLGAKYLHDNWKMHKDGLKNYVIGPRGEKRAMPRYYQDKLYNFKEKQEITERNINEEIKNYWKKVESFGSESAYLRDMYPNRDQKLKKVERKLKQRKKKKR